MSRLKRLNTGIVIENFDKPKFSVHYPNQKFLDYSACFKKLKINNDEKSKRKLP